MPLNIPDWLAYTAAAALCLAGLMILVKALRWDPSRGRPRCPRCWYNMSAQLAMGTLVCPECSCRIQDSARLLKTRRSLRLSFVAIVVIVLSAGLGVMPPITAHGWCRFAPSTALIVFIPSIDNSSHPVAVELRRRWKLDRWGTNDPAHELSLWAWQKRVLASRCANALQPTKNVAARDFALEALVELGPDAKPALDQLQLLIQSHNKDTFAALLVIEAIGPDSRRCAPALTQLLQTSTEDHWYNATIIRTLGHYGPDAAIAVPVLSELVATPAKEGDFLDGVGEAVRTLGAIGLQAESTIPSLIRILDDTDQSCRADAVTSIWRVASERPDVRLALVRAVHDEEISVRQTAASVIIQDPDVLAQAISVLTQSLQASDGMARVRGARALMTLEFSSTLAAQALGDSLSDDEPLVRLFALRALASAGQLRADERAQRLMEDPDPIVRKEARNLLSN